MASGTHWTLAEGVGELEVHRGTDPTMTGTPNPVSHRQICTKSEFSKKNTKKGESVAARGAGLAIMSAGGGAEEGEGGS